MQLDLASVLSGHVFAFMMVFSRLGSGMMMFPGVGEAFVSSRIRMMFALSLSFLVYPVVMPLVPAMPASPAELIRMMGVEILVGLFFGSVMR
ncbi:MAG: flagellar biosynthetic protein FliR, partial [Alphaproteobacteria bacterium]|nr:flagellar biosynthetic protein FliR [Alphaproteobacteria bacterium]